MDKAARFESSEGGKTKGMPLVKYERGNGRIVNTSVNSGVSTGGGAGDEGIGEGGSEEEESEVPISKP